MALLALALVSPMLVGTAAASTDASFAQGPDGPIANPIAPTDSDAIAAPCVGDFNGDGNLDVGLPILHFPPSDGGVYAEFGDGTGHLGAAQLVLATTGWPRCAVADFNGDGRDDLAMVNNTSTGLTVAFGQANGTFTLSSTITTHGVGSGVVAVGDFDDDGFLDILVGEDQGVLSPDGSNKNLGEFDAYFGDGAGTFTPAASTFGSAAVHNGHYFDAPTTIAVGDFNGDGHTDAIMGAVGGVNVDWVALGGNRTTFAALLDQAFNGTSIGVGDLNGDGKADVAYGSGGNHFNVATGDGGGNFASQVTSYGVGTLAHDFAVSVADFNGDGKPDAVLGDSGRSDGTDLWGFSGTPQSDPTLFGPVAGPFVAASTNDNIYAVVPADMDNDGRIDLVLATANAGFISGGTNDFHLVGVGVMLNTTPLPTVVTGPPSSVGSTSATVTGTVGTSGLTTDYGADLFVGNSNAFTREPPAGTLMGSGTQPVSIPITGLTPDTDYRYRVYATNANGTTVGKILSFHTLANDVGSITIVENALPDAAQDFSFSGDLGAFSLDDDADPGLPKTMTFSSLTPGTYHVTQATASGWRLKAIACDDPDAGTTSNVSTRSAAIELDAGESISCTYTDVRRIEGPATLSVWVGLANGADAGITFDFRARVEVQGIIRGKGQLAGASGGGTGFGGAVLDSIPVNFTPADLPPGATISVSILVRNACGSSVSSGTARLWYNDASADSNLAVQVAGSATNYYLLDSFALGTSVGSGPQESIDAKVKAPCGSYKPFGTWSGTA